MCYISGLFTRFLELVTIHRNDLQNPQLRRSLLTLTDGQIFAKFALFQTTSKMVVFFLERVSALGNTTFSMSQKKLEVVVPQIYKTSVANLKLLPKITRGFRF